MAVAVDIKALLEAGVHFGHKTSRWHPKMAPYIHSKRQDSHIIDLTKTVEGQKRHCQSHLLKLRQAASKFYLSALKSRPRIS